MHLPPPGLPGAGAAVFILVGDPREEHPQIGMALWSGTAFQDRVKRHLMTIAKYPHLPLGKDVPYSGIENLRPESQEGREVFASWHKVFVKSAPFLSDWGADFLEISFVGLLLWGQACFAKQPAIDNARQVQA